MLKRVLPAKAILINGEKQRLPLGMPVAELKVIKISKETYAELSAIAGELQIKKKKPVSIDEALKYLIRRSRKGRKTSDLAGSWRMSDSEAEEIKASLDRAWETWKP